MPLDEETTKRIKGSRPIFALSDSRYDGPQEPYYIQDEGGGAEFDYKPVMIDIHDLLNQNFPISINNSGYFETSEGSGFLDSLYGDINSLVHSSYPSEI